MRPARSYGPCANDRSCLFVVRCRWIAQEVQSSPSCAGNDSSTGIPLFRHCDNNACKVFCFLLMIAGFDMLLSHSEPKDELIRCRRPGFLICSRSQALHPGRRNIHIFLFTASLRFSSACTSFSTSLREQVECTARRAPIHKRDGALCHVRHLWIICRMTRAQVLQTHIERCV